MSLVGMYAAGLGHLRGVFKLLLVDRSAPAKPFCIAGGSRRERTDPVDTGKRYAAASRCPRP
jgi:hypothetical protein